MSDIWNPRECLDNAIRNLWRELADFSKNHENSITEQDLELFVDVTKHKAIQDRLTLREDD